MTWVATHVRAIFIFWHRRKTSLDTYQYNLLARNLNFALWALFRWDNFTHGTEVSEVTTWWQTKIEIITETRNLTSLSVSVSLIGARFEFRAAVFVQPVNFTHVRGGTEQKQIATCSGGVRGNNHNYEWRHSSLAKFKFASGASSGKKWPRVVVSRGHNLMILSCFSPYLICFIDKQ